MPRCHGDGPIHGIATEQETYNIESTGLGVANLVEQRTDGLRPVLLRPTLMFGCSGPGVARKRAPGPTTPPSDTRDKGENAFLAQCDVAVCSSSPTQQNLGFPIDY